MATKKRKSESGAAKATATNGDSKPEATATAPATAPADTKTDGKKNDWRVPGSPCHIEIPAHDVARVSKFFTDAFGWKCTPWGKEYVMWSSAENGLGGGFFHTTEPIATSAVKTVSFAIFANDIPAALAKLDSHGGSVTRCNTVIAPEVGAWAQFQDTEGNAHSVFSSRTDNVVAIGESIEQKVLLGMSAHEAYETFMDEKKHGALIPGKTCKVDRSLNGAFSISGGYITGRTIRFEQDKSLVQSWRAVNWPAGHWSTATLTFEAHPDDSKQSYITLSHSGVPTTEHDGMSKGWFTYYWNLMKLTKDVTQKKSTSGWVYRVGSEDQYKSCEKLKKIMPCEDETKEGKFWLFTATQVKGVLKRHFVGSKDAVVFRVCTTKLAEVGTLKWEHNKNPNPDMPELNPKFYPKAGVTEVSVPWSAVDSMIRLPWDEAKKTHIFPADFA